MKKVRANERAEGFIKLIISIFRENKMKFKKLLQIKALGRNKCGQLLW